MKTYLAGLLLPLTGLLAFAACGSPAADGAQADGDALSGGDLDDTIATTLLAGGCSVVVEGRPTTTTGSGGACPTQLSAILDLLEGKTGSAGATPERPKSFVVSEKGDRHNDGDLHYRFVIGSKVGSHPLWVATVSGPEAKEGGAEAIGFSPKLQAFAYYAVEGARWVRKGDGTMIKSTTNGKEKPFACAGCHTSGAPLMKEIHDSCGNWHSRWLDMQKPPGANALFSRLFDDKKIADELEPEIIEGIHLHSKGRVDRARKEGALGGVLKQLMCEVGEPSLIGAHARTLERLGKIDTFSTMLPTSILINPLLSRPEVGGVNSTCVTDRAHCFELGLEQSLNVKLPVLDVGEHIDAAAYAEAIAENGQTIGGQPGDAMFPLSGPQASYADLDAIQELLRQNLIDQDVVADILMTDFTVSSYSKIRCALATNGTMPQTWSTPDELKRAWAQALATSNTRGAAGLKARLENPNDMPAHVQALSSFTKRCGARPSVSFTKDIVKIVSQRRVEFTERFGDVGGGIVESPWLIPKDALGSRPGAIRLGASTCEIEPSTAKFFGEDGAAASGGGGGSGGGEPAATGPIPETTLRAVDQYEVVSGTLNCRSGPGTANPILQTLSGGQIVVATEAAGLPRVNPAPDGKLWLFVQPPSGEACYVSAQFQFIAPRP